MVRLRIPLISFGEEQLLVVSNIKRRGLHPFMCREKGWGTAGG
jgi:hypothetical protein